MATRQASPSLASHAPKVNITRVKINSDAFSIIVNDAIIKVSVRIIASKTSKAINKWLRCIDRVIKANNTEKGVRNINE